MFSRNIYNSRYFRNKKIEKIDTLLKNNDKISIINSYTIQNILYLHSKYSDIKKYITPLIYNTNFKKKKKHDIDNIYFLEFYDKISSISSKDYFENIPIVLDKKFTIDIIIYYKDNYIKKINKDIRKLKYMIN